MIASVDAAGNLVELADITSALADPEGNQLYDAVSLATDPASGVTYVFLELGDLSYYLPVTVATDTVGAVTVFDGEGFEEGEVGGADFDADGSLYFVYDNFDGEGGTEQELLPAWRADHVAHGHPSGDLDVPREQRQLLPRRARAHDRAHRPGQHR